MHQKSLFGDQKSNFFLGVVTAPSQAPPSMGRGTPPSSPHPPLSAHLDSARAFGARPPPNPLYPKLAVSRIDAGGLFNGTHHSYIE